MPTNTVERCEDVKVELTLPPIRTLVAFMIFAPITVLLCCFVTAKIFQNEETYEVRTCNKPNSIPSISAITGIVPQIYFWRTCVALMVAPKIFLAEIYKAYFTCLANSLNSEPLKRVSNWLLFVSVWCNLVDTIALCGLSFVSTHENYVIHEKCFIVFVAFSFLHMVLVIAQFMLFYEHLPHHLKVSLRIKVVIFFLSICLGFCLFIFYEIHIIWCVDNVFSWFSVSEYGLTLCFLSFRWTIVLDFPNKRIKLEIVDV